MLTTLIRLMGAWIAVYGLLFGTRFFYMLKSEATATHIFLVLTLLRRGASGSGRQRSVVLQE